MNEAKILINDLEVNYKINGKGKPLLILHGWGGSSTSWTKVLEILSKKGFRVICPDFPGFGRSKTPLKTWGVGDYVNFVNEFIKKIPSEFAEPFFLLGHSFGGRVAIRFSVLNPQKIKSLILCDSAGIKQKWGLKERLIFRLAKIGNAIFTPKILARFKDKARNLFYVFLRHKDYAKANGTMKETMRKVLDEDILPDLSKIKTKTLIVWGERDKMVLVKYAFVFKEHIKDSKLIILPKIGHSLHLEVPEKLAEIIISFLKS